MACMEVDVHHTAPPLRPQFIHGGVRVQDCPGRANSLASYVYWVLPPNCTHTHTHTNARAHTHTHTNTRGQAAPAATSSVLGSDNAEARIHHDRTPAVAGTVPMIVSTLAPHRNATSLLHIDRLDNGLAVPWWGIHGQDDVISEVSQCNSIFSRLPVSAMPAVPCKPSK